MLNRIKEIPRLPQVAMELVRYAFSDEPDLHRVAVKEGWLDGGEYRAVDVQKRSIVSYPNIEARELEALVWRANWTFYLTPGFLWRNIGRMKSVRAIVRAACGLGRKLSRG